MIRHANMSSSSRSWNILPDPPEALSFGVASNCNHDAFVIAPQCKAFKSNAVHRYNAITGKWDIAVKYPKIFWDLRILCIASDPENNKLYLLLNGGNSYLMACDLRAKRSRRVSECSNGSGGHVYHSKSIVYIKGKLHFFKSWGAKHLLWNGRMGCRASFDMVPNCPWGEMRCDFECRFIAVPTKGIIVLIGGRRATNQKREDFEILKYSVDSKKWSGVGIVFKHWRPTAVLTPSEKYIILSGGKKESGGRFEDKIHVLDIRDDNKWHLYESKVRIPMNVNYHLAATGGVGTDYLVIGWTRELFRKQEHLDLPFPPRYLLQLIGTWIWCEELHWIRKGKYALNRLGTDIDQSNQGLGGLHFSINLKNVLEH